MTSSTRQPAEAEPSAESFRASAHVRPYTGAERRRWCREGPEAPVLLGRARVRPRYRGLYPGLPDSVPVLDRNPAAPLQDALPGSVWIGGHGRLLHVSVAHLQFETGVTHEPGSESPRPLEPAWRFWTRELLSILAFLMRRSSYRGSSESARAQ